MPQEIQDEKSNPQAEASAVASPLKQIRTFQGDVAEALSSQNESLFSIQQKEQRKFGRVAPIEEPRARFSKTVSFLAGSLIFLTLAGVGGWYTYTEFLKKTAPPIVAAPQSRLIATESTKEISTTDLSRDSLLSTIADSLSNSKPNEMRHILLKDSLGNEVTTEAFLTKIGTQAPGSLIRSFGPIFMLGGLGERRFLIIELSSFQNSFAGMLNWEKDLPVDLAGLFSQGSTLAGLGGQSFADMVYKNKDLRVLSSGEVPVLLYSFFNNDTLIITETPEVLQAVVDRLTQKQLTR